jgi:NADH-quinone oxidoreductase subunit L
MFEHVWIIPALPLTAAAVLGLAGRRAFRWAGWMSSAVALVALVLSVQVLVALGQQPRVHEFTAPWLRSAGGLSIPVGILLDPLSALMLVVVSLVSLMVQVYSLGYMAGDEGLTRYYAFLSLFTFSMLGLVLANNLVLLYVCWELVGLCSYLLIGFWYHKPEAANAAKKAFIVTRFGDLGFLIAILVIGFFFNHFEIVTVGEMAKAGKFGPGLATVVALLVFAGAVGKSAQFPLHVWLPDAMEGPTPVSALIHAATMVAAGVFLVARLFPLFAASETALLVVAYLGGLTAFMAATIACVQNDIKRILAYSTISQLGYMMLALGCGGYTAAMFHLTTHAAFKALLFLAAGSVIHALHTNDIWEMGGLLRRMGMTAAAMLTAALALAGFFPLSGFFSKDAVLMAAMTSGRVDLLALGLLTALLTSFYIFRMFFVVFAGKPAGGRSAHESPWVMTVPMLLLAVLAASLGVLAEPLAQFLETAYGAPSALLEPGSRMVPVAATFMAIAGFAWAYLVYFQKAVSANLLMRRFAPLYTLLKNKYYIDEGYQFLVQKILFVVSALMAWFDRNVVDGAVNGVAWLCRTGGERLARLQFGRLQAYLLVFVAGVIVLAVVTLAFQPEVLAWAR